MSSDSTVIDMSVQNDTDVAISKVHSISPPGFLGFKTPTRSTLSLKFPIDSEKDSPTSNFLSKKHFVQVKSLHGSFSLSVPEITLGNLFRELASTTPFDPQHFLFIRNSKRLTDENMEIKGGFPVFVLLKSSCCVPIKVQVKIGSSPLSSSLSFPANMRISMLKADLFSKKVTSIKPYAQKIIIGGRIAHDSDILGDFFLKKPSNKSNHDHLTLFISETINIKHEVDVELMINPRVKINCSFGLSQPIQRLRQIIWERLSIPTNAALALYMKYENSNKFIQLNPAYHLLDYGVTTSKNKIEILLSRVNTEEECSPPLPSDALRKVISEQEVEKEKSKDVSNKVLTVSVPLSTILSMLGSVDSAKITQQDGTSTTLTTEATKTVSSPSTAKPSLESSDSVVTSAVELVPESKPKVSSKPKATIEGNKKRNVDTALFNGFKRGFLTSNKKTSSNAKKKTDSESSKDAQSSESKKKYEDPNKST